MKTDSQLRHELLEELKWEPSIKEGDIAVAAESGVVTLSGFVESYTEKVNAEKAAKRVSGVSVVVNNIEVDVASSNLRPDEDIAQSAAAMLRWSADVPEDRLKVVVKNGFVTLEGTVDWQYQKVAAETIISNLQGIRALWNHIEVKPPVTSQDVQANIEAALKRHAEREARKITVITRDGEVTLRGVVDSWGDREAAAGAAWSAPGVRKVHDELRIDAHA